MPKRHTKWLLMFALWTFIGLASSAQFYLSFANSSSPVTWKFALEHSLADWYLYALLSIPALWLARRLHFERGRWPRQLAVHAAASVVFSILWMAARSLIEEWLRRARRAFKRKGITITPEPARMSTP